MAKAKPISPAPLPSVGGSYLLDPDTGEWVKQEPEADPPAATEPDPEPTDDHGPVSEAPAAGEH